MRRGAVLVALLAACSIERHSNDFECDVPGDCGDGRDCVEGYCIESPCPAPCTSCTGLMPDGTFTECIVDCAAGGECNNRSIECPPGVACTVRCNTNNACGDVDCSAATTCNIECTAMNSCDGQVSCGSGPCTVGCVAGNSCRSQVQCGQAACNVTCSGTGSCDNGVDCNDSCRCDVACTGTGACNDAAACPDATCASGMGCTSAPGGVCNTCP